MQVAAIQMVSTGVPKDNLAQAAKLLEQAAKVGAELAVLPEYFCLIGQHDSEKITIQEQFGSGPIQDFLSDQARQLGLWIVGGTLPLSTAPGARSEKVFNTSLVFNPAGACAARYDKIHLFRFDNGTESYDESRALQAGHQPVQFALPSRDGHSWTIGLSVCYDLRFAELYRAHARAGADLLLVPSAFTYTTGQAHWDLLLRARAVENLCSVAAAAQGGVHENGRHTWGRTMVVDPWGTVLAQQAQEAGVVLADLDAGRLAALRNQLPALRHRVL